MGMFNLPLLLDKSALQSLSSSKIEALTWHYLIVVPPILLQEIMGDLYSKNEKIKTENSPLNTRLVEILAQKIVSHSAVRNVDFRYIAEAELMGHMHVLPQTNFRPCISPTKFWTTPEGTSAVLIDNAVEMEIIHK